MHATAYLYRKNVTVYDVATLFLFYLLNLLCLFCVFDTNRYHLRTSPDFNAYRNVVWTDKKRSIPLVIHGYATLTFCKTTIHPKEGEFYNLYFTF